MALAGEFVESIVVGSEHTLALTADGNVWGWGSNSDGQLGLGHTGTVREPQLITALSGKQVKQVGVDIIIIINNSICLRHISSNKTIQKRITLYMNIQITLK